MLWQILYQIIEFFSTLEKFDQREETNSFSYLVKKKYICFLANG